MPPQGCAAPPLGIRRNSREALLEGSHLLNILAALQIVFVSDTTGPIVAETFLAYAHSSLAISGGGGTLKDAAV